MSASKPNTAANKQQGSPLDPRAASPADIVQPQFYPLGGAVEQGGYKPFDPADLPPAPAIERQRSPSEQSKAEQEYKPFDPADLPPAPAIVRKPKR